MCWRSKWNVEHWGFLVENRGSACSARSYACSAGSRWLARCFLALCPKRSALWTVDSGQLNIASTHTSKQYVPSKSQAVQRPETAHGKGERERVSVYHHKLWLHVSCDSRGRRVHSLWSFFSFCSGSLPAQSPTMTNSDQPSVFAGAPLRHPGSTPALSPSVWVTKQIWMT